MDLPIKNKKYVHLALFTAVAMIFSYIEILIPFGFGIPGVKLGLANITIVLILYLYGWKEALLVNFIRILLSSILFSNPFSFLYSIAGALFSLSIMIISKKYSKMSMIGLSIMGGVFHNIGQLIIALFIVNQLNIFYYGFILIFSGLLTGILIGTCSKGVYKRVETYVR